VTKETKMNEYVDVRGPWPVYVQGQIAVQLDGADRNITVAQARVIANKKLHR
jgi:hypothetical protein